MANHVKKPKSTPDVHPGKTVKFKLQNGLNAIVYRLDDSNVADLARLLENNCPELGITQKTRDNHALIKVCFDPPSACAVYLLKKGFTNIHRNLLANDLGFGLTFWIDAIIYNNAVYPPCESAADILKRSIVNKICPAIFKLVN